MYKSNGKTIKVPLKAYETLSIPNLIDVTKIVSSNRTISNFAAVAPVATYTAISETIISKKIKRVNSAKKISTDKQTTGRFEIEY